MSLQNQIIADNIGTDTENVSNSVNTNSELHSETVVRMRGPDKKPRRFNPKSLQNLKQYRSTIPTSNSDTVYQPTRINIPNTILVIVLGLVLGFVIWKIIDRIRSNDDGENE